MAFVRYSTKSVTLLHYVAGENYMMLSQSVVELIVARLSVA